MILFDTRVLRPARSFVSRQTREEARALLGLAVPLALVALVNMGMSVTDAAMVSVLYGPGALASVAVGSDLYSILFYLGAGLLAGLAPLYSAAATDGDAPRMRRLRRAGAALVAGLGLGLVPVAWTSPGWLVSLGLEPGLLAEGAGYTRAMALTLVPMLGVVLLRTLLTAAERPGLFLKVTLAMLPLNAGLDWLLMRGWGPIPAFGPAGAGWSSFLVACASLAVLLLAERGSRSEAEPGLDVAALREALRLGLPLALVTLAEVGVWLAATVYAGRLGVEAVAAHALALRAAGVAYAAPSALLQAVVVRTARARALGDRRLEGAVATAGLGLGLAGGLALCLLVAGAASPLAEAVLGGGAVAGTATGLLGILALSHLALGPGSAASGLLRGLKDSRGAMAAGLWGKWGLGVPAALLLCEAAGWGITGLWVGLALGSLATTLLALWRLGGSGLRPADL